MELGYEKKFEGKVDPFEVSEVCAVCQDKPTYEEVTTNNGCRHVFCFTCLERALRKTALRCPVCFMGITKISRVNHIIGLTNVVTMKSNPYPVFAGVPMPFLPEENAEPD